MTFATETSPIPKRRRSKVDLTAPNLMAQQQATVLRTTIATAVILASIKLLYESSLLLKLPDSLAIFASVYTCNAAIVLAVRDSWLEMCSGF